MRILMLHLNFAGLFRGLCVVFVWLLFAVPGRAAEMLWEKLPDRERLSIRFGKAEGIAGPVGRIALTGVVVPFTRIPSGLLLDPPPEGAALIKGTRFMGQAMVIETQTPEFGFVVSRQSHEALDIDFFHNPLGARWKPTTPAPTTELPPELDVRPPEPPDAASQALTSDPQGTGPETAALASGISAPPAAAAPTPEQPQTAAVTSVPPAPVQPSAAPTAGQAVMPPADGTTTSHPPALQPKTTAPPRAESAPAGQRPVVVTLSGTPEHATSATRAAQAPPVAVPARPLQPRSGNMMSQQPAAVRTTAGSAAVPDLIGEPDKRSVSLPALEPPLTVSESITGTNIAAMSDDSAPPVVEGRLSEGAPTTLSAATPAVSAVAATMPFPGTAPQAEAQSDVSRVPAAFSSVPGPGIGAPGAPGIYEGLINTGGFEEIGRGEESMRNETPHAAYEAQVAVPPSPAQDEPRRGETHASGESPPRAEQRGAAAPGTGSAQPQVNATIVYTDAEGREIPPPPDPALLMPQIADHVRRGEFSAALEKADLLLGSGIIDRDTREELLHIRAEMLFAVNKDNLAGHYLEIADATNQAMNFNQRSPRNAGALLRLGYVNMKVNNLAEAEARFNMLRRKYPGDENVPLTYYYWGEYHFGRNDMQKAADEFQYILQEYPNSRYARDAALGLARSFYRLGYYEQAFNVVDYVEKRWERFYLDYPPFLNMVGDMAFRLNRLDYALRNYWLYLNLQPFGEEADIILTRIGDIYSMKREKGAARELYTTSVERFPGKEGALVAMMRLAEDGMNDKPSIAGMFSVFEGPVSMEPLEVYRTIISKYPGSALVPLANIKLALWYLWDKKYEQALDILSAFLEKYPVHELAPRAKEILLQAFSMLAAEDMQEQRFGKMREIWEKYAAVRGQAESISPESRVALALSYRHTSRPNEALEILEPFFYGEKIPEYSEMALSLVLSIYLEYHQWQSILDVARRIDLWELTPETQMQHDYAMALAGENLGNSAMAAPLWQRLYDSGKLPPSQMTYATFFLARDAEKHRELEKAFLLGKEALSRLIEQVERTPNVADVGKIQTQLASLMDVSETAGRLREALVYAEQYLQYLPADEPERMAVRYRMARIYKKQGDNESWKKALAEIVAQDSTSVYGQLAASELNAASIAKDAAQFSTTGRI